MVNMDTPRITISEVKERLAAGEKVQFVDARSKDDYDGSGVHLPGALRVPPADAELYANEFSGNALIVAYCSCENEKSSSAVTKALRHRNWKNVFALKGGFESWVESGGDTEPKPAPLSGIGKTTKPSAFSWER